MGSDGGAGVQVVVGEGRLWRDGEPWFPVGVNYHPGSVGVAWLRDWRPDEIAADLDGMAAAGLDVVRVFVYWADVEPELGRHDPAVLDRLRRFGALAAERGIGVVASVLTIWMNGQRFLPPWFGDRHLWRDPVALERAEAVAAAVATAFAASGAALVYDLGDEIPHVDPRSFDLAPAEVAAWQHRMAAAARAAHPGAPVLQANEASAVFARHPFGPDNARGLDLAGLHGFPLWGPRSIGSHASPLASRLVPFLVRYARAHGAVLVDEIGAYLASPDTTAAHLRATLPAVAAAGAAGVIAWSWTDVVAPGRPFDERPSERRTGVVDGTGRPRAALGVLGELAGQAQGLWARPPAPGPPPVALFVPERARTPERTYLQASTPDGLALFHADVLAARAHLPTELTRTPQPHHRLIVSPASGRLTERDIGVLHRAVHGGATLLVTLGDPLHGFPGTGLTGVELVDFTPGRCHDRFTFDGTTYPLRWEAGARAAVVAAPGARVLARFPDGSPALTRSRTGRGEIWFLAAPLEALLDDPTAFDLAPPAVAPPSEGTPAARALARPATPSQPPGSPSTGSPVSPSDAPPVGSPSATPPGPTCVGSSAVPAGDGGTGGVPWHRLYRRIAEEAGATAGLPWCAEPDVDLHRLSVGGRDVVVAVNHTAGPVRARIEGEAWPAGQELELGPKSAVILHAPAGHEQDGANEREVVR